MKGEGFDGSEDGTGRGIPLIVEEPQCFYDSDGSMDKLPPPNLGVTMTKSRKPAVVFDPKQITSKENRSNPKAGDPCHTLPAKENSPIVAFTQGNLARGEGPRPSDKTFPTFQKEAGDQHPCVAVDITNCREGGAVQGTLEAAMDRGNRGQRVRQGMALRRLTPKECERLQGFDDDYTKVPVYLVRHRKKCPTMQPRVEPFFADPDQEEMARAVELQQLKDRQVEVVAPTDEKTAPCGCKVRNVPASECPDGPRYKAIGNSWAVPCAEWIFKRIEGEDKCNDQR